MKKIVMLFCLLMLATSSALAETPREVLVERVKEFYLQKTMLPPDSPLLASLLDGARAKNPQTSEETWRAIREKLPVALGKVFGRKGSVIDQLVNQATAALSEAELQHLLEILNDPVFIRYIRGTTNPKSQKQIVEGMLNSAFAIQAAVNELLRQYSLNEVH